MDYLGRGRSPGCRGPLLLTAVLLSGCALFERGPASGGEKKPGEALRLSTLTVDAKVEVDVLESPTIPVLVEGGGIPPGGSADRLVFTVEDAAGRRLEAVSSRDLDLADLSWGQGHTGIRVLPPSDAQGRIKICASVPAAPSMGTVCAMTDVTVVLHGDCIEEFEDLKRRNPGFGCRCLKPAAIVKLRPQEDPDGSLGSFTPAAGGDALGPYDEGHLDRTDTFTSIGKFEPHFEIEIFGDPGRPRKCSQREWEHLTAGMCPEGQRVNATIHFAKGTADAKDIPNGDSPLYDPRVGGRTGPDNYTSPEKSASPLVVGKKKSHDGTLVHWLDAPGARSRSSAAHQSKKPMHVDYYFHSYVHGSTGKKEDDCDCYLTVKTVVINADGSIGPSVMGPSLCQ